MATGDMNCFSRADGESSQGAGDDGTSVIIDNEGLCLGGRDPGPAVPESLEAESTPSIDVRAHVKTCLLSLATGPPLADISIEDTWLNERIGLTRKKKITYELAFVYYHSTKSSFVDFLCLARAHIHDCNESASGQAGTRNGMNQKLRSANCLQEVA